MNNERKVIVFRTGVLGTWREKFGGIAAYAKSSKNASTPPRTCFAPGHAAFRPQNHSEDLRNRPSVQEWRGGHHAWQDYGASHFPVGSVGH
jgi:hypothetical protein